MANRMITRPHGEDLASSTEHEQGGGSSGRSAPMQTRNSSPARTRTVKGDATSMVFDDRSQPPPSDGRRHFRTRTDLQLTSMSMEGGVWSGQARSSDHKVPSDFSQIPGGRSSGREPQRTHGTGTLPLRSYTCRGLVCMSPGRCHLMSARPRPRYSSLVRTGRRETVQAPEQLGTSR